MHALDALKIQNHVYQALMLRKLIQILISKSFALTGLNCVQKSLALNNSMLGPLYATYTWTARSERRSRSLVSWSARGVRSPSDTVILPHEPIYLNKQQQDDKNTTTITALVSTVIPPHEPIYLIKQQQNHKLHNNYYSSSEHCNSATLADIPDQTATTRS